MPLFQIKGDPLKHVYSAVRLDREYRQAVTALKEQWTSAKPLPLVINGLSGGALDAFCSELVTDIKADGKTSLVIVPSEKEARRISEMLSFNGLSSAVYPYREPVLYNISASHDSDRERLSVLSDILSGNIDVVVTTPIAALSYTMPKNLLKKTSLSLSVGDEMEITELCKRLCELGFSPADVIDGKGQFSHRGGIVDFFGGTYDNPVRIEFFGDEVDRMGHFDILTQRMTTPLDSVSIIPAREVVTSTDARDTVRKQVDSLRKKCKKEDAEKTLNYEMAAIDSGAELNFADKYVTLIYPERETLLSYLSQNGKVATLIFDTNGVNERLDAGLTLARENCTRLIEDGVAGSFCEQNADRATYEEFLNSNATVHINTFSGGVGRERLGGLFGFRCRRTVSYDEKHDMLVADIKNYVSSKYRIFLVCRNTAECENLRQLLDTEGISAVIASENTEILPSIVYIMSGYVNSGYELIVPRVAVLSMHPDEAKAAYRQKKNRRYGKKQGAGEKLMSFADLTEGDYVVHAAHGIGRFEGMQTLVVDGVVKDYITIAYAGTDKLFLPAERLELISKYIGARADDGTVKLSRIGGTDWEKAKTRAKRAAENIAKDLIALYAARMRKSGYAFPEDSEIEKEFEDSFEFEETEPQLAAVEEIKKDMQRPIPMERLLCGDVGFGKTEVALRAAFKAVVAGKQVAILVPTTILALQHYQTVLSRMRGYPVNVEMICRFRTPTEQTKIFRRLKRGEIDIIIGTHSLLGKRTEFKDLGLLIVDEEQRFGVSQKEKIKTLAEDVDVLTLTATPIPRTLNMAMTGIRDMSILDEAPRDRFPVQSYVLEHDDLLIAEAMRREISRGGQVLYLFNKVEYIHTVAAKVMRALPEARVTVAHGKMDKEELEDIWQALVRGDIDILVCTTIIETGIDLPNANTLIIEDADRLGLSQLHQIRGRVGRGGRQAYAYFTYRPGKSLTDIARKRLEAIREFAEFGAGFKIALRDLEIRGAGNILGAEQHGHIDSIGYDLYVKILNEAILNEQNKKIELPFEASVDIRDDANIPDSYIRTSAGRMEMYKKLTLIESEEDYSDILDEFCDRFGEPPKPTLRLLDIALVRALAAKCRISKVTRTEGEIRFLSTPIELDVWSEVFTRIDGMRFPSSNVPYVAYKLKKGEDAAKSAKNILIEYAKAKFGNSEAKEEK